MSDMAGEAARVAVERCGSCRDAKAEQPWIRLRQGYGATGYTDETDLSEAKGEGRRRLFGQLRNILIFVFLDENAEHIHE